jgi:hypothetical protein
LSLWTCRRHRRHPPNNKNNNNNMISLWGRLFTMAQCQQMNQLAEQHAYQGIGTIGAGWSNEKYTLTDQHFEEKEKE